MSCENAFSQIVHSAESREKDREEEERKKKRD
jgi:hypothetical protein